MVGRKTTARLAAGTHDRAPLVGAADVCRRPVAQLPRASHWSRAPDHASAVTQPASRALTTALRCSAAAAAGCAHGNRFRGFVLVRREACAFGRPESRPCLRKQRSRLSATPATPLALPFLAEGDPDAIGGGGSGPAFQAALKTTSIHPDISGTRSLYPSLPLARTCAPELGPQKPRFVERGAQGEVVELLRFDDPVTSGRVASF